MPEISLRWTWSQVWRPGHWVKKKNTARGTSRVSEEGGRFQLGWPHTGRLSSLKWDGSRKMVMEAHDGGFGDILTPVWRDSLHVTGTWHTQLTWRRRCLGGYSRYFGWKHAVQVQLDGQVFLTTGWHRTSSLGDVLCLSSFVLFFFKLENIRPSQASTGWNFNFEWPVPLADFFTHTPDKTFTIKDHTSPVCSNDSMAAIP